MTVRRYLVTFEAAMRPLVAAIALGLIWIGATRMEGPAQSRYATRVPCRWFSLRGWRFASVLGLGKCVFRDQRNAVADRAVRFADPADDRCRGPAAVGKNCKPRLRDTAILDRGGPSSIASEVRIFLVLWANERLPANSRLPAGIGDVMTGCFAVVVAVLLAQKAPGALRAAYGWCLFGIADLVVAVTMGQ